MHSDEQLVIDIDPTGVLSFIYDDEMSDLCQAGDTTITRASHVEPCEGGWSADMSPVGGPILGPCLLRSEALAAEKQWLLDNNLGLY